MRNPYEWARKNKEKHPEWYCAHKDCLWQTVSGYDGRKNPCRKHPSAGNGKPKEPVT